MKVYSIIIVDAKSGIPFYAYKSHGNFINDDDRDVLFSGAMVAIQNLMKEFDGGQLQTIKTKQFQLLGETGERLVVFAVGNFPNEKVMFGFMKKLLFFVESQELPEIVMEFEENTHLLINTMIDQFIEVWKENDISSITLLHNDRLGFQNVLDIQGSKSNNFLIGYLSSLSSHFINANHSFIFKFNDDSHILGILLKFDASIFVQVFIISNSSLQKISSHKNEFVKHAYLFLEEKHPIIQEIDRVEDDENAFSRLNAQLSNKLIHTLQSYSLDMDFLGINNILDAFDAQIALIIGSLLAGHSLLVVTDETEFAKPIIDVLVYVTGINSVDLSLDSQNNSRLGWTTKSKLTITDAKEYMILDLNEVKVLGGKEYSFFTQLWKSIKNTQPDYRLRLYELRSICNQLWEDCDDILSISSIGKNIEDLIDDKSMGLKNRKAILCDMIDWLNPHIRNNQIKKYQIIKRDALW